MQKWIKAISITILTLTMFMSFSIGVFAQDTNDSYMYTRKGVAKAPPACVFNKSINHELFGTIPMKGPQDLFSTENYLYVVDTGNNRVLKLDKSYSLIKEYTEFTVDGKVSKFSNPTGIFIDTNDNLLVADTDNQRLVKLDKDGKVLNIYGIPQSKLLPQDFDYKPTKVVCDFAGRIFVTVRGFNMGLIELDKDGNFVQFLGSSKVTYNPIEALWRYFSTKEQKKRMTAFVPAEYNNISIDSDGFLFATTGTNTGHFVRKINAKGDDVLKRQKDFNGGDLMWNNRGTIKGPSQIVDCVNLDYDLYAILDQKRARVFVYDQDGINLFIFGSLGQTADSMASPTSITMFNHDFLVLDTVKNRIVSYSLTDYGQTIINACRYRYINDYEKEKDAWKKVYSLNNNNHFILGQMGKIAYRQRDMQLAMKYFKEADNRIGYSKAFQFRRRELINQYFNVFGIILITVIVLCIAYKIFIREWRKIHPKKEKKAGPLRYAFYVIFRPLDGFWDLKHEKRGSLKVSILLIIAASIAVVLRTTVTAFTFNWTDFEYYNVLIDLAFIYVPVTLWIASTWCVTTLMDGEGSFKDIVISTGYCLTPIILILPCTALFSNLLIQNEGVLIGFFNNVAFIWTAVLLIASVIQTHNYSFRKTIGVILISLLVIIIIIFMIIMCLALVQMMYAFVNDLKNEIVSRM